MSSYDIVLCTYNGYQFIEQQLKSILEQGVKPSKIVISDDGSKDNTLQQIKQIFVEYEFDNYLLVKGEGKGVVYNFLSVLKYSTSEYIFLADQDDIWLPNKAEEFLKVFEKSDPNKPTLIFSDATLIDEQGQRIADSFFSYQGLSPKIMADDSILYRNCVQGASCAFNRHLREIVIESLPLINIHHLYMHDWWIALLARYYGKYQFIDKPLLEYRQHRKNQVGVFNKKLRFFYYISRFKQYLKNFQKAIGQMKEFELFSQSYIYKPSSLLERNKRKYNSVSKLKIAIIRLLRI